MSEDEKDIDVESEEDDDEYDVSHSGVSSPGTGGSELCEQFLSQADKRAHHNALERKRRDHIKESFHSLRDAVPVVIGEKVSRAQILKKAAEYISFMRRKNTNQQQDIDDIKKQNNQLEHEIRALEKTLNTSQYSTTVPSTSLNPKGGSISAFDGGSGSESSDELRIDAPTLHKKLKAS